MIGSRITDPKRFQFTTSFVAPESRRAKFSDQPVFQILINEHNVHNDPEYFRIYVSLSF